MTEHSKEVMERRRQVFEAAFLKKYGFGRLTAASNSDAHAMYEAALWAWNSALDSIEIELPAVWAAQMLDGDQVLHDCRYAIESTGLGLRVKA